jgi:hypothetical protein
VSKAAVSPAAIDFCATVAANVVKAFRFVSSLVIKSLSPMSKLIVFMDLNTPLNGCPVVISVPPEDSIIT